MVMATVMKSRATVMADISTGIPRQRWHDEEISASYGVASCTPHRLSSCAPRSSSYSFIGHFWNFPTLHADHLAPQRNEKISRKEIFLRHVSTSSRHAPKSPKFREISLKIRCPQISKKISRNSGLGQSPNHCIHYYLRMVRLT